MGANLLFIPEFSTKAKGSVHETAVAAKMMFLAKRRETPPKDLGLDLLILKDKRWKEDPYNENTEDGIKVAFASGDLSVEEDPAGWFKIEIDREDHLIAAIHYPKGGNTRDRVVKGRTATEIYRTLIRLGQASTLDHAAYLGKELEKADMALRTGKSYIQDGELFNY